MVEYELKLNKQLLELFRGHNINGFFLEDQKTVFFEKCIKACCYLYNKTSTQTSVIQLDVIFKVGFDKEICESCAGIGSDIENAVQDAFKSFARYSFIPY